MTAITKKYAERQLKRFLAQKSNLEKITTTADQRRQLNAFYDKEIAFWKGWAERFKKIDQEKANETTVIFETIS